MYDLKQIYHITCVLTTIGLVSWVCYEYSLDEDATQIHINQFHKTADDIYPSITICIDNPFSERKLKEIHPILTKRIYQGFLRGTRWPENDVFKEGLINIDYENVTYQLEDLINQFEISILGNGYNDMSFRVKDKSLTRSELVSGDSIKKDTAVTKIDTIISARESHTKCVTFNMPYVPDIKIHWMSITINASVFPGMFIMPQHEQFYITFGYPNQFLQSQWKNKLIYDKKVSSTTSYRLDMYVGSMEVIRRRDKLDSRCNENWRNQDEDDRNNILKKIGCNPKYWNMRSNLPYCSNHTQYQSAIRELHLMSESIPPCKRIEKLTQMTYEIDESPNYNGDHNRLMLRFFFNRDTVYKEIRLVRAFNLQSLIGNAGKEILSRNY